MHLMWRQDSRFNKIWSEGDFLGNDGNWASFCRLRVLKANACFLLQHIRQKKVFLQWPIESTQGWKKLFWPTCFGISELCIGQFDVKFPCWVRTTGEFRVAQLDERNKRTKVHTTTFFFNCILYFRHINVQMQFNRQFAAGEAQQTIQGRERKHNGDGVRFLFSWKTRKTGLRTLIRKQQENPSFVTERTYNVATTE